MRIPKRISEILNRKQELLDKLRNEFDNDIIRLQSTLFESVISKLIPNLKTEKGVILDTAENYKLITEIDKTFSNFQVTVFERIIPSMTSATEKLTNLSKNFFNITLETLPLRFEKIIEATKKLTDARLGLYGGKVVRGGNIWTLVKGGTDNTQFKRFVSRAVTSNMSMSDFVKEVKIQILGEKDQSGMFERQFKRYAYDIYGQYDRTYDKKLSEEFNLTYFIYSGGKVKDTRDFCMAHDGKVWTTEESEEWPVWTPMVSMDRGDFPAGYEVQQKDLYAHPGYMDYPGYDPLTDCGGWNCRHKPAYISENLAFRMRPELKE